MVNTRIVNCLIWCWAFLMLAAGPAHAFYHANEKSEDLVFQRERFHGTWGKGERAFALYDNFNCFSAKHHQGPAIYPSSDKFVPADVFVCNIPLRIAIRQTMTVEDSLADLVYRNLKLKKLLEEQEAQKERALEVLAGLRVPFVDFRMTFLEQSNRESSIHKLRDRLVREQQDSLKRANSSFLTGTEYQPSLRNRFRSSERGRLYLESRPLFQARERISRTGTSSMPGTPRASQRTDGSQPASPQHEAVDLAYGKGGPRSWISRMTLEIGQYLVSHMIEAVIYGFLLLFVIDMLISKRSRRDR